MKINQALDSVQGLDAHVDDASLEDLSVDRGARARERLLHEAMHIFAEKGFAKASTREICHAAGLNVASIHYYFGDKAGLYRAVLLKPIESLQQQFARFDDPAMPLPEALRLFMSAFLCPSGDEEAAWCLRLHLREMLEPSLDYANVIAQHVSPHHQRLLAMLGRHVGADVADDALHQLAFALVAMVHDYGTSKACINVLAPSLLTGPQAMDKVLDRLVGFGLALIDHDRQQRAHGVSGPVPVHSSHS